MEEMEEMKKRFVAQAQALAEATKRNAEALRILTDSLEQVIRLVRSFDDIKLKA